MPSRKHMQSVLLLPLLHPLSGYVRQCSRGKAATAVPASLFGHALLLMYCDNVCRAWQSRPMAAAQDQYDQLLNISGCFNSPPDSVSESPTGASHESRDRAPAIRNITAELRCLQSLDLSVLLKHADHAGSYSDSLDSSRYAPVIDGTELHATPL